ncbi:response regulator transcription factor [Paenibacillus koleovorans]|uniref:response regulator transcription factor n=1 Tax=Paenibacillus koleovorans TaxID=121608 RepID=UPI000FDC7FF4|nr:response regulator [Paenibacillus koleovorans]
MRIVVVEDQQELCHVLAKRISRLQEDYEIAGKAFNGRDGLQLIRAARPDAAFIDIRMPGLDGLQLMEELAKEEKQRTRCIVLTAYADFPYTQRAIRSGAFDYLLKPVSTAMLEEVLERVAAELQPAARRAAVAPGEAAPAVPAAAPAHRPHDGFALDELAEQQLHQLIRERKITDELVLQVLHIIRTEYAYPITVKELAERLHVNVSHLCRVYSRKVGTNLIQSLNSFRLNLAVKLMEETDAKIGDIARRTGFGNLNYFGRMFRKHTGLSPSAFKQRLTGGASQP